MSFLGFELGVYPHPCRYEAQTGTCKFFHKGISEVSKAEALAAVELGSHKTSPYHDKLVQAFEAQLK
jgi:hypothetical protein